jgi:hypothetical protein
MDQDITHACHLIPGGIGMFSAKICRQMLSCFSKYLQAPDDRVYCFPVGRKGIKSIPLVNSSISAIDVLIKA